MSRSLAGRLWVAFALASGVHGLFLLVLALVGAGSLHELEAARLQAGQDALALHPDQMGAICVRYHLLPNGQRLSPQPLHGILLLVGHDNAALAVIVLFWVSLICLAGAQTVIYAGRVLDWLGEMARRFGQNGQPSGSVPVEIEDTLKAFERLSERLAQRQAVLRERIVELERDNAFRGRLLSRLASELSPEVARLKELSERGEVEVMRRNAAAMVTLLGDLRDAGDLESNAVKLALAPVDLRDCLAAAVARVRPLAEARGVALQLDADSYALSGDRGRLEQIAVNLLSNAIKFSPDGETVIASLEGRCLSVRDRGPGMARAQRAALGQDFNRGDAAASGSGLGLAISRRLAELHGARLEVMDREGGGTVVAVRFPEA